jgi:RNA polymerase sigma-70 factor (ECF subfamily)
MSSFETENRLKKDAEILIKVKKGDKSAYLDLVYHYQNRLRSFLSFYCHSKDEIEEFTQEAFVEAYSHLNQFDVNSSFFPWLRTIALNSLRMEIRRKSTERRHGLEYLRRLQMSRALQKDAEEEAEKRLSALDQCVQKLPEEHIELIKEKYRNNRSYADMSKIFGSKKNTLRIRLMRIKENLRQCIEHSIHKRGEQNI